MTRTGIDARPEFQERAETFMDGLKANSRAFSVGGIAIVAIALSAFLYSRWSEGKAARAEQALGRAEQTLAAGNLPLAQTDLQRVLKVYGGTSAASQAALLLAQVQYEQEKFQEGVNGLQAYLAAHRGSRVEVEGEALLAAGYEELGKPSEAAQHYRRAADLSRLPADKSGNLADAARTLTDAHSYAEARTLWAQLAADRSASTSGEARVRLGELDGLMQAASATAPVSSKP